MPEIQLIAPAAEPVDRLEAQMHCNISDGDLQLPKLNLAIMQGRSDAEMQTRKQCLHARYMLVLDAFPAAGIGAPLAFGGSVGIPGYAVRLPHAPAVSVVLVRYLDMAGAWQTMDAADYATNLTMMPGLITPVFGKIWPVTLPQIGAVQITYDAGHSSPVTATVGAPPAAIAVRGPVVWAVGAAVQFSNSGGALPTPLKEATDYLIASVGAGGAYTITDAAGGAVTIADAGAGTHYIGPKGDRGVVPADLRGWICIRAATLYEHREEVAILGRGKIEELPFMRGLLDAHRVSLP